MSKKAKKAKKAATAPRRKPGRMLRPRARVLKDSALIPAGNVVKTPPKAFTHKLQTSQPYFFTLGTAIPDGTFLAGTRVKLTRQDGDEFCWVIDENGLKAATKCKGLRPILRRPRTS
jgi:hypothetical protein